MADETASSSESGDTLPDGSEFPWAQDLDGTWHFRPADDPWGDPEGDVQAHGRCGVEFGSVHVSTSTPVADPELDERMCEPCQVLVAAAWQSLSTPPSGGEGRG